jgi:hypothetical protein
MLFWKCHDFIHTSYIDVAYSAQYLHKFEEVYERCVRDTVLFQKKFGILGAIIVKLFLF